MYGKTFEFSSVLPFSELQPLLTKTKMIFVSGEDCLPSLYLVTHTVAQWIGLNAGATHYPMSDVIAINMLSCGVYISNANSHSPSQKQLIQELQQLVGRCPSGVSCSTYTVATVQKNLPRIEEILCYFDRTYRQQERMERVVEKAWYDFTITKEELVRRLVEVGMSHENAQKEWEENEWANRMKAINHV